MRSFLGKALQPPLAHAAYPAEAPASGGTRPLSVEALGWDLRAALPALRLHSVSIYDRQGNVLWLSEGALGPDEHALVVEALERFDREEGHGGCEQKLEDGRTAAFLPLRPPQGSVVGLVMILAEFRVSGEGLIERVATAPVRTAIQHLAALLRPADARTQDRDPTGLMLSLADDVSPASPGSAEASMDRLPDAPAVADRALTSRAVDDILEGRELALEPEFPACGLHAATPPVSGPNADAPPAPAVDPMRAAAFAPAGPAVGATATPDAAALPLEVLPFVKLRAGGRMRRFEVMPRGTPRQNRDPAALDVIAVQALLSWLAAHRSAWTQEPTGFTLNLSIATLEDDRFLRHLAAQFARSGISADTLGFEIAEPLCIQRRAQVERFINGCERLGCFVVVDGFSFDSAVVPLLRSKAVRLVKIDSRLTATVMKDKLSQAMVVAIVQAVKVLGIHCAAQHIDTQPAVRWLTGVGCDFAQGRILARSMPIERLGDPLVAP